MIRRLLLLTFIGVSELFAEPVDEVDPFIGTGGNGHTTPAAAYPLGMVQAGPDTDCNGWEHCSGYTYDEKELCGFSQTHLNGTGCLDLGDLLLLPFTGEEAPEKVGFDKTKELASPGYYAVTLADGTRVEITAAPHSAIYRIQFAGEGTKHLLFDCSWGIVGRKNLVRHIKSYKSVAEGPTGFSGEYTAKYWAKRDCAFEVVFDRASSARRKGGDNAPRYVFDFDLKEGEPLMVKIGLSRKSAEAAKANLKAEIPAWDFEGVRAAARTAWNDILSRTTVEGEKADRVKWYTGLYHLFFQPNNIADVGEKPFYSTFSCWDTFRAAGPLYTILAPEINADFVDSMLEQGRITGYLPIWTLWGYDNQCMIGTHSIPMIVDEFLKDVDLDLRPRPKSYWESAYAQIKDTLTKKHDGRRKERWDLYDTYGYYPCDIIKGESVSRTVECGYDDWCAAQMAEKLGHAEDAAFFLKRANYWKNVFDPEIKKLRGKDSKGAWRTPFNPYALGHNTDRDNDFTEGNAFHYTWHVLHDPKGLIAAMGGAKPFVDELDALYAQPTEVEGMGSENDCTGQMGQYAHGNEPSHHVAYLYALAGAPEKTASRVREICNLFYTDKPDGLCGNEDCGQMSAWYLFSAMGFYPLNPCGGEYVLGAPQVEKVVIDLSTSTVDLDLSPRPKKFTILAKNHGKKNKYVKSITLNGKPYTDRVIRHADIMAGGELVFEMTPILTDVPTTVNFTSGKGRFHVAVDCVAAPDLQGWVETRIKPMLSEWLARLVDDFACEGYQPKTNFICTLVRDLKYPGTSDSIGLNLNATYIRQHTDDVGMVVHEIWHQLQNYTAKCPTWLSEGIDDWVRYYYVEKKPPKVDPAKVRASDGYGTTAAFLEWCGGRPFVGELITALRQGSYTPDWWRAKTGASFKELERRWKGVKSSIARLPVTTEYGIGNTSGSCLVGPCMPYGSAHPSPDSVYPIKGRKHAAASGYFPGDPVDGFSQVHAHGAGSSHPSYGLFLVRPCSKDGSYTPTPLSCEETSPHRFKGRLESGVAVTIVPTQHGAFYRFDYPKGQRGTLAYDVRRKIGNIHASEDATLTRKGPCVWGGGTYSDNWNPGSYSCHFYAEEETVGDSVLLRIAISFKDVKTARRWFGDELKGRTEETLAAAAESAWRKKLAAIEVKGLDSAASRRFYSNFYHAFIQPRNRSGDFAWCAAGEPVLDDQYTVWDTWRTLFPLLTIVDPKAAADNVNSYAVRQRRLGRCEIAFIAGNDFQAGQGGDDVDIVIADAFAKNLAGIDRDNAWRVVEAHAARRTEDYRKLGWAVSRNREGYDARFRSGSSTLAFAYNDWCAAQVASATGRNREARELLCRSGNWTNVWDRTASDDGFTGFVRARGADGVFSAVSPKKGSDFYQGTGWEYSFFVPHDMDTLIAYCGGSERFLARLDAAFAKGRIRFSNEPSFLTPFLANWCGRPDRTVSYVKRMLASFTDDGPPGDDDSGAMGSLYVFLKAGFFPVAGQDLYVLHGTDVPLLRFNLGNGRSFTVRGTSDGSWTTATLNGQSLEKPFIRHSDILAGGELVFGKS